MERTIGAPIIAVIVLTLSSFGAKSRRASQSLKRQNAAPTRKEPAIIVPGSDVRNARRVTCGAAIPIKEIGPAKAVTVAERRLEPTTRRRRKTGRLIPTLCAYSSP